MCGWLRLWRGLLDYHQNKTQKTTHDKTLEPITHKAALKVRNHYIVPTQHTNTANEQSSQQNSKHPGKQSNQNINDPFHLLITVQFLRSALPL